MMRGFAIVMLAFFLHILGSLFTYAYISQRMDYYYPGKEDAWQSDWDASGNAAMWEFWWVYRGFRHLTKP